MDRRVFGSVIFGGVAGTLVAPKLAMSAVASVPGLPLVGAWRLLDAVTVLADGREGYLDGRKGPYTGTIIYTPERIVAVQIASARTTLDSATPFDRLPDAERLSFLDTYEAYFGTYDVDEAAGIVRHHCEASLDPTGPGLVYERRFSISGDILTIRTTADKNVSSDGHYNRLRWKRVRV
jgi:hypothetical protein